MIEDYGPSPPQNIPEACLAQYGYFQARATCWIDSTYILIQPNSAHGRALYSRAWIWLPAFPKLFAVLKKYVYVKGKEKDLLSVLHALVSPSWLSQTGRRSRCKTNICMRFPSQLGSFAKHGVDYSRCAYQHLCILFLRKAVIFFDRL